MDPFTGMIAGSLGGSLLGGIGGLFDDSQKKAAQQQYAMMQSIINGYRAENVKNQLAYRDARKLYGERTDQVLADLGRAEAEMRGSSREAQRGVAGRGAQTQASVTQNLASRGLGNSTVAMNAQRGIAADTSRGIAGIQQQEGSMLAGLNTQRAGIRAGLMGDQAELPIRQQQSGYNIARDRLGYMGGVQFQAQPNQLSGLLGSAGGLLGLGLAGGFGGMFGGGGGGLGPAFGAGGMGPPSPWGY